MLARLAKQFFARGRARLQRVKTHPLCGNFMLAAFVGFIECVGKPCPFGTQLGKIALHVTQPALRCRQAGFGLGELAGFGAPPRR